MKRLRLAALALLLCGYGVAQQRPNRTDPEFLSVQTRWVDSVFNTLSNEQRIAQLFMVAAYSNLDMKHVRQIKELVTDYHIGGLIWMQGGPARQGQLATYYQKSAKTPLLYSTDGEWGLAMRLDSTPRYPRQMTLGAIRNDSLIYQMGRQIGRECRRVGLHVNFAPVADVNNNPGNPVIGMRSFGEDKVRVAHKSYMYMQGMQDERVMANAKHFPGHGDTDVDSHAALPIINHPRSRLDSLELYPFRYMMDRGLASVMVAHLSIPSLDTTKNLASTLSPLIVKDLLQKEMGFKGLIFTDALSMKGVTKFYEPGMVDVKALIAGNDVLLFSEDVPRAMKEIAKAIERKEITQEEIDERCRKILKAKFWCGLNGTNEVVTRNMHRDLNTPESAALNEKLAGAAVTVLKNKNNFIPIKGTDTLQVAEVSFGVEEQNTLGLTLRNYCYTEHIGLAHDASAEAVALAMEKIREADMVVLQVNKTTISSANNYGIGSQTLRLMDSIAAMKPTVLALMTNPYLLNKIPSLEKYRTVMVGYEYMPSMLRACANVILGSHGANGQLPVSTSHYKSGSGMILLPVPPKEIPIREGIQKKMFRQVDSIALSGITQGAYPGCQVAAIKDGELIYQKAFGSFTYNRDSKPVDNGTWYDLASITKIASTSLALMKLTTEGKFDYRKTLGDYLPELKGTNKENLVIEDVLSHQAGLVAWIPFYQATMHKNGKYKPGIFSKSRSEDYPLPVARKMWVSRAYMDSVYQAIIVSKVEPRGKYLYSDLGYYFMQRIIENITGMTLKAYVEDIYWQIGVQLTYLPLKYFSRTQVAPTENDEVFRKQTLQGYVHDQGAALQGGVAGHAGLFGNAREVAWLMQLFLNKGELNGVRVIDSNVVKDFTSCHFCPDNRRGLCFEKPEPDLTKQSPVSSECSLESFGHSGFTGTFAWADPRNNLVVVFLSNRIYPNADNPRLVQLAIRSNIHKAFYDALKLN
jgi:beta-N-acetylhexosaminidase